MLGPVLVVVAGFAAALIPVSLGWSDLPYALPEIVIVAGAVWAWAKARTTRTRIAAGVLTAAAGFHLVWVFFLSTYEEVQAPPAKLPDVEAVRVRDGAKFTLGAQRGRDVLLVFFRGAW